MIGKKNKVSRMQATSADLRTGKYPLPPRTKLYNLTASRLRGEEFDFYD